MENNLDLIDVAQRIMDNNKLLAIQVDKLIRLNETSAKAQSEYDKKIGVAMATHKAAGEPVGVLKEYAKRDCADDLLVMIVAEGTLKACYANIEAIKTRINAYQSILKYLDAMPGNK